VDYWLACERGDIEKTPPTADWTKVDIRSSILSPAMKHGIEELSQASSFRMFPVFWQVFLWSWGGFLLKDRLEEEFADLERETGVPVEEIPIVLSVFDKLFPLPGGWFKDIVNDSRRILILMPAAVRGIGAFRRKARKESEYKNLGFEDLTASRMISDHNASARVLDCIDADLVK
jgi:hypothetical protein